VATGLTPTEGEVSALVVLRKERRLQHTPGLMAVIDIICHSTYAHFHEEAAMQSMNISLPEPLKEFVDAQIASGRYSTASEYIRELIRDDEKRKAEERLEALLLEGLQGKETPVSRDELKAIRKEALAKLKVRKQRG
jgi:antitoxin ParD1/3/4